MQSRQSDRLGVDFKFKKLRLPGLFGLLKRIGVSEFFQVCHHIGLYSGAAIVFVSGLQWYAPGLSIVIIFIFSSLLIIVLHFIDCYNCTEHPPSRHRASTNPVHFNAQRGNARLRDTKVRHH